MYTILQAFLTSFLPTAMPSFSLLFIVPVVWIALFLIIFPTLCYRLYPKPCKEYTSRLYFEPSYSATHGMTLRNAQGPMPISTTDHTLAHRYGFLWVEVQPQVVQNMLITNLGHWLLQEWCSNKCKYIIWNLYHFLRLASLLQWGAWGQEWLWIDFKSVGCVAQGIVEDLNRHGNCHKCGGAHYYVHHLLITMTQGHAKTPGSTPRGGPST